MSTNTQNPIWNRNWTFVMATAGAAVGLGNIWKFPYIAGENGGGAFVLMYLVCILLFGIPVMIAEVMLGKCLYSRSRILCRRPYESMCGDTF